MTAALQDLKTVSLGGGAAVRSAVQGSDDLDDNLDVERGNRHSDELVDDMRGAARYQTSYPPQ